MQPAKLAHMFGWRHIHRSKQLHQLIPGRRVHVIIKYLSRHISLLDIAPAAGVLV